MLPLRYGPWWRAASALLLLLVLAATIMPVIWLWPDSREFVSWLGQLDKIAHTLVFAFLALWFAGQYGRRSYWRIALGLLAFGIFTEICQRLVGYRSAEQMDVVADFVGIIIGLLIAGAGLGGWCQRFEARFLT